MLELGEAPLDLLFLLPNEDEGLPQDLHLNKLEEVPLDLLYLLPNDEEELPQDLLLFFFLPRRSRIKSASCLFMILFPGHDVARCQN
jgi:hypothetical protein